MSNESTWAPTLNGNVIIIGTDPVFHLGVGIAGAGVLIQKGLAFAGAQSGKTGLYLDLSCYYNNGLSNQDVPILDGIETGFQATSPGCADNIHITATAQKLLGLTDADLSNWSCSVHEYLTSWPKDFIPVAIDTTATPPVYTAPDGTSGDPYIIGRGVGLSAGDIALAVSPSSGQTGTSYSLSATVESGGAPTSGVTVTFTDTSGPNAGATGTAVTGASGIATFSFTSTLTGTDSWTASFTSSGGTTETSAPAPTTTYLGPPSITSAVPANVSSGGGAVTVSWSPPASDGGSPETGYVVDVCPTSDGSTCSGATTSTTVTGTSTTVSGLTNGANYLFTVAGVDNGGTGAFSPATEAMPGIVPGAPTAVTASANATVGGVDMSWAGPTTGTGAISGYVVEIDGAPCAAPYTCAITGTTASITGLTDGTSYSFAVAATNSFGTGAYSGPQSATPGVPLGPVSGLSVTTSSGQANLTWTAPPAGQQGAGGPETSYVVSYGPCPGAVSSCSETVTGTIASFSGLTNGTAYTFTVVPVNVDGTGPPDTATATPSTVPGAPTSVSATPGDGTATVNWASPLSDGGDPVTSYQVTYSPCASSCAQTVTLPASLQATFSGLTNGESYTFSVTAQNSNGSGVAALTSAMPSGQASAPSIISATPGNGTISVAWSTPSFDGGTAITGYVLEVDGSACTAVTSPISCTVNGNTAVVSGLANGTSYAVSVAATNANGTGAYSAPMSATPATAPDAPLGLTATPGNGQAALTWSLPAFDGGSAVTGYLVTWCATTDGATCSGSTDTVLTGTSLSYDVTGLSNGTEYLFSVYADNAAGLGAASVPATATPSTVPGAPTSVTAVDTTPQTTGVATGSVSLTFVAPSSDGGSPVTGYAIDVNGTDCAATAFTCAVSGTTATVSGLSLGSPYSFAVVAENANGAGALSAPATVTPSTVPQSAPAGLAASAGNDGVSLSWAPVAPSGDGGSAITGYVVTYGTCDPTLVGCTSTTSLLASGSGTDVTGLTNGTTYYFTVQAMNPNGEGPQAGSVGSTPASVPGAPTGLSAVAGNTVGAGGEVELSWTAPADTGGSAISGYVVTVNGMSCTSTAFSCAVTGTAATVTGLANGAIDSFAVQAVNGDGTGPASAPATAIPSGLPTAAPSGVAATAGDGKVALSWSPLPAPSANGSPVVGYRVSMAPCPVTGPCSIEVGGTDASVGNLSDGTSYSFSIQATNGDGDGPSSAPVTAVPYRHGYLLATSSGMVYGYGDARPLPFSGGNALHSVVGITATPDANGYWLVGADGSVAAHGDAHFHGSLRGRRLGSPIVGIVSTPDGKGYWLVAAGGGVFHFGDAKFFGSLGGRHLRSPIVGMASTPDGKGYWLAAAAGGVFHFGDARPFGSRAGKHLNKPVVGIASTPDGKGYWLVAGDGGVFSFGDAYFSGSLGHQPLKTPVVGMLATTDGAGYLVADQSTGVAAFGDGSVYPPSNSTLRVRSKVVGIAS